MRNFAKCALLILTVALCVVGAQAQSTVILKGNVPFSFNAGNFTHPAGTYTVKDISQDSAEGVEGWSGPDGHAFIVRALPLNNAGSPGETMLVFHRYGDEYYLAEVWSDGNSYEVKASPKLQQISKKRNFETVAVLMTGVR